MTIASATEMASERSRSFALRDRTLVTLVSALVVLPSALFATALRPLPALAVLVGCAGTLALVASRPAAADPEAPCDLPRLALCLAVALGLLLLGGETHLFFAPSDWLIRDAVLGDLVRHGFPVLYRFGETDFLLRAPLGMYLVPALVGRGLGPFAAQVALLTQNALFLGTIFYLLTRIGRGWPHLLVMILFAGLSVLGAALRVTGRPAAVPFWLQWGLDGWHPMFQFSGSIVQFFWVPNHALPGWWLATLWLRGRRSGEDVATLGVSTAALAFWSPLAVVPAVPWLGYLAATRWRSVVGDGRTWLGLAAGLCFVPLVAYMLLASASIAHADPLNRPNFLVLYGLFLVLQLPALAFVGICWKEVPRDRRALVAVAGLALAALPFVGFGPNNDLVMRASIAPLAVVAFVFGAVLLDLTRRRRPAAAVGWLLVAGASPSAAVEIGRALSTPRYAASECSLLEASRDLGDTTVPANYVVPVAAVPAWLLETAPSTPVPLAKRGCWPDLKPPRLFGVTETRER